MRQRGKPPGLAAVDGFSLIEVLIAVIILSIGLLGMARLQIISMQNNNGAFYRSQATLLANEILDRMRLNLTAAGSYAIAADAPAPAADSCVANPCDPAAVAQADLMEWRAEIARLLPAGTGSIVVDANNVVTVDILWTDPAAAAQEDGQESSLQMRSRL
ncbi:MAG: type IV pilus modification protein PilV [Pseudomonadota bacterium]|nr:type IV pilus modification protein PilV [Pseudomonadota bacterium]